MTPPGISVDSTSEANATNRVQATVESDLARDDSVSPELQSQRGTPVWEIARVFPNQGEWSEEAYLALDTNQLIEFTDGFLEFLPMTTRPHQRITRSVFYAIDRFVVTRDLGEVLFAPLRVRLRPAKYREPDIVFIRHGHGGEADIPDGADLVVEVVSPSEPNRQRDLVTKRKDYARAGISEYWIVDPAELQVTVLVLDGNAYREHGVFVSGEAATSQLLDGFSLAVDSIFNSRRSVGDEGQS